jgi:hypothetical protein
MPYTIILHLPGEPSVIGEVEELPTPTDMIVTVNSPRQKDGKDLHYLEPNVVQVIWPLNRISLIEVLEGEEDEPIIGFVRE